MDAGWMLPLLLLLPVLMAVVSLRLRTARGAIWFCAAGTLVEAVLGLVAAAGVFLGIPASIAGNWLMLDALSAYHLAVMMVVFSISGVLAVTYFRAELDSGSLTRKDARRYAALWFGSLSAMTLVLTSNNLGVMWVGIEATTLLTAFMICTHVSPGALEAMWKYLLMCSVGVAVAFTGILLIAASTGAAALHGTDALLWTNLMGAAGNLDKMLLKAGFIFIVIGYGTKAGLAPMHNWLPDAHSQAPAPVSAIFSGFLLNAALYCILRCLPLVEVATGHTGWGRGILVVLGIVSILVAAVFIVAQRDVKRMLAYSSLEHLGIITLGAGLGGLGAFAALFHMANHSVCKTVSFCCAGMLGQAYGTNDMRRMGSMIRVSPVWGRGLATGLLALIGVAPFAVFLSEFFVLKAAVDCRAFWTAGLLLAGLAVVFVGVLRQTISLAWDPGEAPARPHGAGFLDGVFVAVPLLVILVLGVWMPPPLVKVLGQAARILGGTP